MAQITHQDSNCSAVCMPRPCLREEFRLRNHQQDRQKKKFRVAVVGTLAALATVVVPGVAHAGFVANAMTVSDTKAGAESWWSGWSACRATAPTTKSIKLERPGAKTGTEGKYAAWWRCWDTPQPND